MKPVARLRRLPSAFLAVLAAVVSMAAVLVPGASPAGAAAAPGTLLSAEPASAYLMPLVPLAARVWHVTYSSRTALGAPTVVGGTVLVPTARWTGGGARPLVGYAIGSQGLADRCAPSVKLAQGLEYESENIAQALAHGWAIALTDYPGLGVPGEHPYVVGPALGRAVLDSMRAARQVPGAGIAAHGPAGLFGYSEGGNAAGWAAQLQPSYAPDLPLAGAALGAAPADFLGLYHFLSGGPFAFLLLYSAMGFDTAYPDLHLDSYLNAAGLAAERQFRASCLEDAIPAGLLMPKSIEAYTTRNPFDTPAWQRRLRAAGLGAVAPHTPVMLGSAAQDEVIPYSSQVALARRWCRLGVDVRFVGIPLGEHVTGMLSYAPTAFSFLDDRFAGTPAARGCDS